MTPSRGKTEIDPFVLAIVRDHAGGHGLSGTAIFGHFPHRSHLTGKHISKSLTRLLAAGMVKKHGTTGSTVRWTLPGVKLLTSHLTKDTALPETPAMSKALENLFALTPHRYGHGDVVTLERGRVGLRPSIEMPGRATGAW